MAKGKRELETQAEKARKARVDVDNKKASVKMQGDLKKLADTPLNDEERGFCEKISAKMNAGRKADSPQQHEVLRYSRLRGRMSVIDPAEDEVDEKTE